jgi:phage-related protein
MAVVGEAYIIVKAITSSVERDIKNSLKGVDRLGSDAGKSLSSALSKGIKGGNISSAFKGQMAGIRAEAAKTYAQFNRLAKVGNYAGTAISLLVSSVGSLAGGLVSLVGALLSATPAALALGGAFASIGVGALTAKLALSGVFQAVQKLIKQDLGQGTDAKKQADRSIADAKESLARVIQNNKEAIIDANKAIARANKDLEKSQYDLTRAIKDGREEVQQLGFDAEDAALQEKKASIDLEKARIALARVQDLPPNSRARREAELAYQEADLNLRRAKDKNKDLQKEQDRLAKEGKSAAQATIDLVKAANPDIKDDGLIRMIAATDGVRNSAQSAIDAAQGVADAEEQKRRAVVNAAQSQADAEKALARAQEDAKRSIAGADPLAGLTETQKQFAKFLADLRPQVQALKEAAAASFLPKLQEAITTIVRDAFPTIKTGVGEVGSALGDASKTIANAIADSVNLTKLAQLFKDTSDNLRTMGNIIGSGWGIILSVLNAVQPLVKDFLDYLDKTAKKWDDFLNSASGKARFAEILKEAERVAKQIGAIFGNVTAGIGNIVKANTGPGTGGQILLDYFQQITASFRAFSGSAEGQNTLKKYFADVAENAKAILGFFGDLVKIILQLGADKNVKIFWDTLRGALPYVQQMVTAFNGAGPEFGKLLVNFAKFLALVTQSDSVVVFFKVLNMAMEAVNDVLSNKLVRSILGVLAFIHGIVLAFQSIGFIAGKVILYVIGAFEKLQAVISIVIGAFRLLAAAAAANPLGAIIVAITALIAIFVMLFKHNEAFHDLVMTVWGAIKDFIGTAVDAIIGFLKAIPSALAGIWNGLLDGLKLVWTGVQTVWNAFVAGVRLYVNAVIGVYKFIWDGLVSGLNIAWNGIKAVWGTITSGVSSFVNTLKGALGNVWNGLTNGLSAAWQAARMWWNTNVASKQLTIGGFEVFGKKLPSITIGLPSLAEGGTVYPRAGGTIARVAEAGRAERIEPLDPDGLSKRDKALIAYLTGAKGGAGNTFNVYPSPGMNEVEIAAMVSRQLAFQTRKGSF